MAAALAIAGKMEDARTLMARFHWCVDLLYTAALLLCHHAPFIHGGDSQSAWPRLSVLRFRRRGDSFWALNGRMLERYAACADGAGVVAAQAAFMAEIASEREERRAGAAARGGRPEPGMLPPSDSDEDASGSERSGSDDGGGRGGGFRVRNPNAAWRRVGDDGESSEEEDEESDEDESDGESEGSGSASSEDDEGPRPQRNAAKDAAAALQRTTLA